jgi:hypothetical protein
MVVSEASAGPRNRPDGAKNHELRLMDVLWAKKWSIALNEKELNYEIFTFK